MALRIGPVGPVREAGLGSAAGLGSEVTRLCVEGTGSLLLITVCIWHNRPINLTNRKLPVAAAHSKCGPAPRYPLFKPVGAAGTAVRRGIPGIALKGVSDVEQSHDVRFL